MHTPSYRISALSGLTAVAVAATTLVLLSTPAAAQGKARRVLKVGTLMVLPALSPSGDRIAYSLREPSEGTHGLYVARLGGGKAKRLATGLGATFSPSGRKIAYFSDEATTSGYTLSIMGVDGNGGSLSVMGKDPTAASPSFASDGSMILYVNSGGTYVIPTTGQVTKRISNKVLTEPQWAPTLDRVLFQRKGGGLSIMDVETGKVTNITRNFEGFDGRWSPDGSKVLYGHEDKIYIVDLTTHKRKEIIEASRAEWTNSGLGIIALWQSGSQTNTKLGPMVDYRAYWVDLSKTDSPVEILGKTHVAKVAADGRTVALFTQNDGIYRTTLKKLPGEKAARKAAKAAVAHAKMPQRAVIKIPKTTPGGMPDADTLKAIQ